MIRCANTIGFWQERCIQGCGLLSERLGEVSDVSLSYYWWCRCWSLLKVVSARFLPCTGTSFAFVNNQWSETDCLRQIPWDCVNTPPCSPTTFHPLVFVLRWWLLLESMNTLWQLQNGGFLALFPSAFLSWHPTEKKSCLFYPLHLFVYSQYGLKNMFF